MSEGTCIVKYVRVQPLIDLTVVKDSIILIWTILIMTCSDLPVYENKKNPSTVTYFNNPVSQSVHKPKISLSEKKVCPTW